MLRSLSSLTLDYSTPTCLTLSAISYAIVMDTTTIKDEINEYFIENRQRQKFLHALHN